MEGLVTLQLYRFVAEERNYRPLRLCNKMLSARAIFLDVHLSTAVHLRMRRATPSTFVKGVLTMLSQIMKSEGESCVIELVSQNFCGR